MNPRLFFCGCLMGSLSVAGGAFGAHALKDHLSPGSLLVWETGARYLSYHAAPVLLVALHSARLPGAERAGWAFVLGTLLFTGSLWALALSGQHWLGAITPFGGLSLIAGWGLLAWAGACAGFHRSEHKGEGYESESATHRR